MSKHNNNLSPCTSKRCNCGRYITIGESKHHTGIYYECPDCVSYRQTKYFNERFGITK